MQQTTSKRVRTRRNVKAVAQQNTRQNKDNLRWVGSRKQGTQNGTRCERYDPAQRQQQSAREATVDAAAERFHAEATARERLGRTTGGRGSFRSAIAHHPGRNFLHQPVRDAVRVRDVPRAGRVGEKVPEGAVRHRGCEAAGPGARSVQGSVQSRGDVRYHTGVHISANVCHSGFVVPIDTERLPVQLPGSAHACLLLLGARSDAVLSAVAARRPPTREVLLPGAGAPLGEPGRPAPGRSAQLHAVPAHDALPAELVHQPGRAGYRRAAVPVRARHLPRRGATLVHCDPGRQNAVQDDQLERRVQLGLDHDACRVLDRRPGARHLQAILQDEDRLTCWPWRETQLGCPTRPLSPIAHGECELLWGAFFLLFV
uniref:Uncharacterized protein n=1 Tax=Anopheles farauti TaxID=69004 RepID=A0A182QFS8_9DIPT